MKSICSSGFLGSLTLEPLLLSKVKMSRVPVAGHKSVRSDNGLIPRKEQRPV